MADMNQFVPDFHQVDYGSIPSSSGVCHFNEKNQNQNHDDDSNRLNFYNNNYHDEEGLMEMLWSNGQMVQRSLKSHEQLGAPNLEQGMCSTSAAAFPASELRPLFMQEDEMASWLHYPIEEDDRFGGTDLVFPATPPPAEDFVVRGGGGNAVDQIREAQHPVSPRRMGTELQSSSNFGFFNPLGRMLSRGREPPTAEANAIGLGLGVESDGGDLNSIVSVAHPEAELERNRDRDRETSSAAAEKEEEEIKDTAEEKKKNNNTAVKKDLKRKGRLEDEEDDKSEATGRSKRGRGSSSARRTRAAEVHNLSERRRRDRINEKMKALQELIPHCNRSDKASMLDDAIEYVKQLQQQVQLLSMRCNGNAMPMVFPDGQTYLAPIGVGMGMPMPMPMPMQFPHLGGPSLPRPFGPPPLVPRLPIPAYLPPPTGASLGGSRMPANQPDPLLSHYGVRGLNAMAVPFPGPYPHYLGHYGLPPQLFPPPQVRPTGEASTSRTSEGGGGGDLKAQK